MSFTVIFLIPAFIFATLLIRDFVKHLLVCYRRHLVCSFYGKDTFLLSPCNLIECDEKVKEWLRLNNYPTNTSDFYLGWDIIGIDPYYEEISHEKFKSLLDFLKQPVFKIETSLIEEMEEKYGKK